MKKISGNSYNSYFYKLKKNINMKYNYIKIIFFIIYYKSIFGKNKYYYYVINNY